MIQIKPLVIFLLLTMVHTVHAQEMNTRALQVTSRGSFHPDGYLFKTDWEISGRFTNIGFDTQVTGNLPKKQYTLGLSKYIVGHKLKVQTDLSYLSEDNEQDALLYRLQAEVHF